MTPRNVSSFAALALAALCAAPALASAQADVLTLRGAGSQIGATFGSVPPESAGRRDQGALVIEVQPKSPAAEAGIRPRDLVTEFDGIGVRSARDMHRLVAETPPGRTVSVMVVRDGRVRTLKVIPTLGRVLD